MGLMRNFFNSFSNCYIASTGIIVPRATALEMSLLVLYCPTLLFFFSFFDLGPELKRPVFAVCSCLTHERELLTSSVRCGASGAPESTGSRPHSPPRSSAPGGVFFLAFPAPPPAQAPTPPMPRTVPRQK